MDSQPFRYRLCVRYSECDAQQVVFDARYADDVDLAMTEFLRAIGRDYARLLARGLDNQIVELTLAWQAPARFDDVLEVRMHAPRTGHTSFTVAYEITHAATGSTLCRAEAIYVMMSTDPFEKAPVPENLRAALVAGASGCFIDHSGG